MKKPVAPCLKCEERRQFCHAECEKYKTFRKALDDYNEARNAQNNAEQMMRNYETIRAERIRKKYD